VCQIPVARYQLPDTSCQIPVCQIPVARYQLPDASSSCQIPVAGYQSGLGDVGAYEEVPWATSRLIGPESGQKTSGGVQIVTSCRLPVRSGGHGALWGGTVGDSPAYWAGEWIKSGRRVQEEYQLPVSRIASYQFYPKS